MTPDYVVLGHITRDIQPDGSAIPGGTVTYAAITAQRLGLSVGVLTTASDDVDIEATFTGIDIVVRPAPVTTTFQNIYLNGKREQYVQAVAPPLRPADVPDDWKSASIVHLGPLVMEIGEQFVDLFRGALLGVTPQGWMRSWDGSGLVEHTPWQSAGRILSRADVLVISEEDVGGNQSLLAEYLSLAKLGVVTDGWRGAVVYGQAGIRRQPSYAVKEIDPTGAGDVFAAAYFIALWEGRDPYEAARFANAVASFSVEAPGLAGIPTRHQVNERLVKGVIRRTY